MSSQLTLLDTYCGEGGCTKGYQMAGFRVVGVDNRPMKRYCGDEFFVGDAIEFIEKYGREFDVIHASPPCQLYSKTKSLTTKKYPDLVGPTREALQRIGRPYVIENVVGAPLANPLMLCGTMFGLGVFRHRLFEMWPEQLYFSPATCKHDGYMLPIYWGDRVEGKEYTYVSVGGNSIKRDVARKAMQIEWMGVKGLSQAIPPKYTEYIGRWMMRELFGREPIDPA